MQKTLKVAKILQAVGTGETDRAQPGYSFPDIPPKHTHTNKHVCFPAWENTAFFDALHLVFYLT